MAQRVQDCRFTDTYVLETASKEKALSQCGKDITGRADDKPDHSQQTCVPVFLYDNTVFLTMYKLM